jgi:3-hydroxyacyl-CoA dehydrogenase/enoyl-CoA hydratase/3-hydroxybutyryl-CoA epimerase
VVLTSPCSRALRDLYVKLAREKGEARSRCKTFFDESRKLSQLYRKLETCGKPFAAAVHGVCLGGAFELALACQYRVVSDDASTRVGLPEIKVGLFPGAGGTQRVARLMQTGDALQMMFKGEQVKALPARNSAASSMPSWRAPSSSRTPGTGSRPILQANAALGRPQKGFKLPSNKVHSPAGMQIWPPASAIYRRETNDNYPAARAILSRGL